MGDELGLDPRRMDRLTASFTHGLVGLAQQPIHRGLRAQVAALVEQDRVHLTRCQVDEAVLVEDREHLGALGGRQRPRLRPGLARRLRRCRALAVPPVVRGAGAAHRGAGGRHPHEGLELGDL